MPSRRVFWDQQPAIILFADGLVILHHHLDTFDGDWVYWAQRLMRDSLKPTRVVKRLKRQRGKCNNCQIPFPAVDVVEVHHVNGNYRDNRYVNLSLRHGHCHDLVHGTRC